MARTDATPRKLPGGPSSSDVAGVGLERGAMIGRYIVLGLLGEGGMGTVASAYDPELDRKVALKLVRADAGSEDAARLVREARALARFSHPNVVAVHDVGESGTDVYLAMELVDGVTLREWMREKRPWREVVRVFVAAGRGLAAAHAAGLVHRDVKPANILLGRDGRVRVVDFGLARTSRSLQPEASALPGARRGTLDVVVTAAEWIGTPAYMAPEQFVGVAVDARADQWAFCVALHEALYRVRPFLGNDDEQVRRAVIHGVPVATQDGDVPASVRRIVLRGLMHGPDDRFADMNELLAALERARRRRPLQLVALALALALGVAGAVGAGAWSLRDAPPVVAEEIESLTTRARAAAAKAYFVYPPIDEPDHPTAYRTVLELERSAADNAASHATKLRREFADTLVRLGDRYWDVAGGRAFAIDYYAQALVFAPDDEHARTRATLTVGELAALRQRADDAEFSEAELEAAEVLVILAEPESAAQKTALQRHRARPRRTRGLTTDVALDDLLGPRARAREPATPVASEPAVPPSTSAPAGPVATPKVTSSGESANDLVARARKAWKGGDAGLAETLLHRALAVDAGHVGALAMLSDLHFDRGAYSKAVDFAAKAVARAPKRADLRIAYGDALFKVLRYTDARKQYAEARALGHAAAAKRLAQVDAKLGTPG